MEVRGRVEYDDEVIHVIAQHMTDATPSLHALSDDLLKAPVARADHVTSPLPPGAQKTVRPDDNARDALRVRDLIDELHPSAGHPRNARIIPKSRDFH